MRNHLTFRSVVCMLLSMLLLFSATVSAEEIPEFVPPDDMPESTLSEEVPDFVMPGEASGTVSAMSVSEPEGTADESPLQETLREGMEMTLKLPYDITRYSNASRVTGYSAYGTLPRDWGQFQDKINFTSGNLINAFTNLDEKQFYFTMALTICAKAEPINWANESVIVDLFGDNAENVTFAKILEGIETIAEMEYVDDVAGWLKGISYVNKGVKDFCKTVNQLALLNSIDWEQAEILADTWIRYGNQEMKDIGKCLRKLRSESKDGRITHTALSVVAKDGLDVLLSELADLALKKITDGANIIYSAMLYGVDALTSYSVLSGNFKDMECAANALEACKKTLNEAISTYNADLSDALSADSSGDLTWLFKNLMYSAMNYAKACAIMDGTYADYVEVAKNSMLGWTYDIESAVPIAEKAAEQKDSFHTQALQLRNQLKLYHERLAEAGQLEESLQPWAHHWRMQGYPKNTLDISASWNGTISLTVHFSGAADTHYTIVPRLGYDRVLRFGDSKKALSGSLIFNTPASEQLIARMNYSGDIDQKNPFYPYLNTWGSGLGPFVYTIADGSEDEWIHHWRMLGHPENTLDITRNPDSTMHLAVKFGKAVKYEYDFDRKNYQDMEGAGFFGDIYKDELCGSLQLDLSSEGRLNVSLLYQGPEIGPDHPLEPYVNHSAEDPWLTYVAADTAWIHHWQMENFPENTLDITRNPDGSMHLAAHFEGTEDREYDFAPYTDMEGAGFFGDIFKDDLCGSMQLDLSAEGRMGVYLTWTKGTVSPDHPLYPYFTLQKGDQWLHYIAADNMVPDSIRILDEAESRKIFETVSGKTLLASSGAGAWEGLLNVNADGSFAGYYYDSDMGIETTYECSFSGRFSPCVEVHGNTYWIWVEELNTREVPGTSAAGGYGDRIEYTDPPFSGREYLVLTLPGTPTEDIPETVRGLIIGTTAEWDMTDFSDYMTLTLLEDGWGFFADSSMGRQDLPSPLPVAEPSETAPEIGSGISDLFDNVAGSDQWTGYWMTNETRPSEFVITDNGNGSLRMKAVFIRYWELDAELSPSGEDAMRFTVGDGEYTGIVTRLGDGMLHLVFDGGTMLEEEESEIQYYFLNNEFDLYRADAADLWYDESGRLPEKADWLGTWEMIEGDHESTLEITDDGAGGLNVVISLDNFLTVSAEAEMYDDMLDFYTDEFSCILTLNLKHRRIMAFDFGSSFSEVYDWLDETSYMPEYTNTSAPPIGSGLPDFSNDEEQAPPIGSGIGRLFEDETLSFEKDGWTFKYKWGPGLFRQKAQIFNRDLAITAAVLSWAIEDKLPLEISNKFRDLGITDGKYYSYNMHWKDQFPTKYVTWDSMYDDATFAIGRKVFSLDQEDDTTLIIIIGRGTQDFVRNYEEYLADLTRNGDGPEKIAGQKAFRSISSFETAMWEALEQYMADHPIQTPKAKFLIAGHSLGGAMANCLSGEITNKCSTIPWLPKGTTRDDIYVYTFGAIKVLDRSDNASEGYENIHNVYNYYDSFGPYGKINKGVGSPFMKFGHTELYALYFEEHANLFVTENHNMQNYLTALQFGFVRCDSAKTGQKKPESTDNTSLADEYTYKVLPDGSAEITGYLGTETEVYVPSELDGYPVTRIGYRAFYGLKNIERVWMNDVPVTRIGAEAFRGCEKLCFIQLPQTLKEIGARAFDYCIGLTDIVLPDQTQIIGWQAFSFCSKMEEVYCPESLLYIDSEAFIYCPNAWFYVYPNSRAERYCCIHNRKYTGPGVRSKGTVLQEISNAIDTAEENHDYTAVWANRWVSRTRPDLILDIVRTGYGTMHAALNAGGETILSFNCRANVSDNSIYDVETDPSIIYGSFVSLNLEPTEGYPLYLWMDEEALERLSADHGITTDDLVFTADSMPDPQIYGFDRYWYPSEWDGRWHAEKDGHTADLYIDAVDTEMGYSVRIVMDESTVFDNASITSVDPYMMTAEFDGFECTLWLNVDSITFELTGLPMIRFGDFTSNAEFKYAGACVSPSEERIAPFSKEYDILYTTENSRRQKVLFSTEMFQRDNEYCYKDTALLSMTLSAAAYNHKDKKDLSGRNIVSVYRALGFDDKNIMLFNYDGHDLNTAGFESQDNAFSIASRNMGGYTLLIVTLRGPREDDMIRFLNQLKSSGQSVSADILDVNADHEIAGFTEIVAEGIKKYIGKHYAVRDAIDNKQLKVLITGHSLGGAAANLLGACIMGGQYSYLPVPQGSLYVYTFGAPRVFWESWDKPATGACPNIFNFMIRDSFGSDDNSTEDPVTFLPGGLNDWRRFGKAVILITPDKNKKQMEQNAPQIYLDALNRDTLYALPEFSGIYTDDKIFMSW